MRLPEMFRAVGQLLGRQVAEPFASFGKEPVAHSLPGGSGGGGAVVDGRPTFMVGRGGEQLVVWVADWACHGHLR